MLHPAAVMEKGEAHRAELILYEAADRNLKQFMDEPENKIKWTHEAQL